LVLRSQLRQKPLPLRLLGVTRQASHALGLSRMHSTSMSYLDMAMAKHLQSLDMRYDPHQ
jgi:hypothetical protein